MTGRVYLQTVITDGGVLSKGGGFNNLKEDQSPLTNYTENPSTRRVLGFIGNGEIFQRFLSQDVKRGISLQQDVVKANFFA